MSGNRYAMVVRAVALLNFKMVVRCDIRLLYVNFLIKITVGVVITKTEVV